MRVQLSIKGSIQRSVSTTPYELLFSTKLRTPEDVKVLELLEEGRQIEFVSARNELRIKVAESIAKVQAENSCKSHYKKKSAPKKYDNPTSMIANFMKH